MLEYLCSGFMIFFQEKSMRLNKNHLNWEFLYKNRKIL